MVSYSFEDLVGDEKVFFAQYFDKKPMLRKGGLPGRSNELLSVAALDQLLHLEVVRPPYIKVNLNGDGVPEKGYTRDIVVQGTTITDVVDPERIYALFRAGATIAWSSLNHMLPEVRNLARLISHKLAVRTDPVGFLTPAGRKGYPPHHDPVDLFILQLEGTKHWKLWNPEGFRLGGNGQYTEEGLGEPAIEVLLEPGDVLYLPYGTPHAASAEDQTSLHLSIMMRPRMWRDLIRDTVEQVIQEPAFLEYPHIGDLRDPGVHDLFREKLDEVVARLAELDPAVELDRLVEVGRTSVGTSRGTTFQSMSSSDVIGPDAQLRRTRMPVEFGRNDEGRTALTVSGHKIAVPTPVAETLAGLAPDQLIEADSVFPGVVASRSVKVAQILTRLGVFETSVHD
jgi:ribosomal protein L16 Arg81 hydroxylase